MIAHVKSIIEASPVKPANLRILLTGHSLGGVVAILAAHDLATELGLNNTQVPASCFSFCTPFPWQHTFSAHPLPAVLVALRSKLVSRGVTQKLRRNAAVMTIVSKHS